MVAYLLIIMATILVLTYIAYRLIPLADYGLSPKILAICGLLGFGLGLLATQIVVYIHDIGLLFAVLTITVLISSSILVYAHGVSAEPTVDHPKLNVGPDEAPAVLPNFVIPAEGLVATLTEHSNLELKITSDVQDTALSDDSAVSADEESAVDLLSTLDDASAGSDIAALLAFSDSTADKGESEPVVVMDNSLQEGSYMLSKEPVELVRAFVEDNDLDRNGDESVQGFNTTTANGTYLESVASEVFVKTEISITGTTNTNVVVEQTDNDDLGTNNVIFAEELAEVEAVPSSAFGHGTVTQQKADVPEVAVPSSEPVNTDFEYYLELGFSAQEHCNYKAAIIAFQKAIDLEPGNSATLLVIVEVCALLKLLGYYDEAINQMERGRSLAVRLDEQAMIQQFVDGIAYLRILKNTLMTEGVIFTPYQALSTEIKNIVDDEFRQWKINS